MTLLAADPGSSLATALGVIGSVLTLSVAAPQAVKVWRDRASVGVSGATWWLFCMLAFLWIGYSIREGNALVLWCKVFALVATGALVLGIHRFDPLSMPGIALWVGIPGIGSVVAAVGFFAPVALVSGLLVAIALIRVPQIRRSFRTWREVTPSEVSRVTWWVGLGSGVCWEFYGILLGDVTIMLASLAGSSMSATVVALEHAAAGRRRRVARVGTLPAKQTHGRN